MAEIERSNWLPEPGASFESLMDALSREMSEFTLPPGGLRYLLASLTHAEQERGELETDSSGAMIERPVDETESSQPFVAVRHLLRELATLFTYIVLDTGLFSGRAYRYITAVQCTLVHVGLYHLESMLTGRRTFREKIIEAGRQGQRIYTLEPPVWQFFHLMPTRQRNLYCYDRSDYARMEKIHEEYRWDMTYIIQMAMVVGIVHSEKLPQSLRDLAEKEVEALKQWIGQFNN